MGTLSTDQKKLFATYTDSMAINELSDNMI